MCARLRDAVVRGRFNLRRDAACGLDQLLERDFGTLHGTNAGVGIHLGKIDGRIGLLGIGGHQRGGGLDVALHLGIDVGVGGQPLHHPLHAGQLGAGIGAHGLDLGLVQRVDQGHGAVDAGMHLGHLLLGAGHGLEKVQADLGGGQPLVGLHALQVAIHLPGRNHHHRRQQRGGQQFIAELHL